MGNRYLPAYAAGRLLGRLILIRLGYVLGKGWDRRPI